jgi:hypothetical protein
MSQPKTFVFKPSRLNPSPSQDTRRKINSDPGFTSEGWTQHRTPNPNYTDRTQSYGPAYNIDGVQYNDDNDLENYTYDNNAGNDTPPPGPLLQELLNAITDLKNQANLDREASRMQAEALEALERSNAAILALLQARAPGHLPYAPPGPLPHGSPGPLLHGPPGPLPHGLPGPLPYGTPGPLPHGQPGPLPHGQPGPHGTHGFLPSRPPGPGHDSGYYPRQPLVRRHESALEHVEIVKAQILNTPDTSEKITVYPSQQQQMSNISSQVCTTSSINETLSGLVDPVTVLDINGIATAHLAYTKNKLFEQINCTAVSQKQVNSANRLASEFKVDLQKPELIPAPPGFYKDPAWLQPTKILKEIALWDPTKTGIKFKSLWTKIVRYCTGKHFTEAEYQFVLGSVLSGKALDDFTAKERSKQPLYSIVNELFSLYDAMNTLDEHKYQLDNFKRLKSEPLVKAMSRAVKLINKLYPLYTDSEWQGRENDMTTAILRQIISEETRIFIDLEEGRSIRERAKLDVHDTILLADQHEKIYRIIPTEEVETTFQVVSMTPRKVQQTGL